MSPVGLPAQFQGLESDDAARRRDAARVVARMSRREFLDLPAGGAKCVAEALRACWDRAVLTLAEAPRDARLASELKALALALAVAFPDEAAGIFDAAERDFAVMVRGGLLPTTVDALTREFAKARVIAARERTPVAGHAVADEVALCRAVEVALFCRAGLEEMILARLRALRLNARHAGKGLLLVHMGSDAGSLDGTPFAVLKSIRFWHDAGFVFPFSPGLGREGIARLIAGPMSDLLAAFGARVRFDWQAGRGANWDLAGMLTKMGSRLVNAPREAAWDLMIDTDAGRIVARPKSWFDDRYAYRGADVPASSHAPLAAALAELAAPLAGEWVWDPFCGAGTELIEAARIARRAFFIGSDVDPAAVKISQANAAAAAWTADGKFTWSAGDFRTVETPEVLDVILTNPPLGRRVAAGEALALADQLIYISAKRLRPGTGRLVWVAPDAGHCAVTAMRAGLKVVRTLRVDLGGFDGEIQVLVRA